MKLSGSVKFKSTACKHDNYKFSKRISKCLTWVKMKLEATKLQAVIVFTCLHT